MVTTLTCPKCGGEMTAERIDRKFEGVCPRCLFRSILGNADVATLTEAPPVALPTVGGRFGNYTILGVLGSGGMGVVYKARQQGLERNVALKVLPAGQDTPTQMVDRFLREARAAANLHHPNIVPIHEVSGHEGAYFYSMELIEGKSLSDWFRERPQPSKETLELLIKIARAVHYANEQGVIHRDLKPANVMVDGTGEPKVLDFGIAKLLTTQGVKTTTGNAMGTPPYMSPEQVAGAKDLDARADVYSLGAILYEALTGRPPHTGETAMEIFRRIATEEPERPSKANPQVPRDLEAVCLRALAKERQARYVTCKEFASDLRRHLDGSRVEAPPARGLRARLRYFRRNAVASLLAALILLVVLIGGLVVSGLFAAMYKFIEIQRQLGLHDSDSSQPEAPDAPSTAPVPALAAAQPSTEQNSHKPLSDSNEYASLEQMINQLGLASLSATEFRKKTSEASGVLVSWELRIFNGEACDKGFSHPDSFGPDAGVQQRVLLMAPSIPPRTAFLNIPKDRRVLVALLPAMGSGLSTAEKGETVRVNGTIWGADPIGEWKVLYLKNYTVTKTR